MTLPLISQGPQFASDIDIGLPNTETRRLELAQLETLDQVASSFAAKALFFLPQTILSMADTFAETLSFGLVGDDDLEDWLVKNTGSFGRTFVENRAAVGAVGDIVGAFIPGMLAVKAMRQGSRLAKFAEKALGPGSQKFFSTGLSNAALFEKNFQQARMAGLARSTNLAQVPDFISGKKAAILRSVADTAIEGVAADAAIAFSMNESDFLFPEEFSVWDHLAFFGGANIAIAGVAGLIARRTFKRGADKAWAAGKATTITPTDTALKDAVSNVLGERGPAIALYAQLRHEAVTRFDEAHSSGNQVALDQSAKDISAIEQRLKDLTEQAFLDSPIEGVTRAYNFKNVDEVPEIRTMLAVYSTDPQAPAGLRSLEKLDADARIGFEASLATKLAKNEADFRFVREQLSNVRSHMRNRAGGGSIRQVARERRLINKSEKLRESIDDLHSTVAIVGELDGSTTALAGRAEIFQDTLRDIARKEGTSIISFKSIDEAVADLDLIIHPNGQVSVGASIKDLEFTIDENFNFINAKGAAQTLDSGGFADLTHIQKTAIYDGLQDRVNRIKPETFEGTVIPDIAHFTQLDYLIAAIGKHGDAFSSKIGNFKSLDDLTFRSLEGKFMEYQLLRDEVAHVMSRGETHIYQNMDNIAKALNLPGDNSAVLRLFEQSRVVNDTVLLKTLVGDLDGFKEAIRAVDELPAGMEINNALFSGNMLRLPFDGAPVMIVLRNIENRAGLQAADLAFMVANLRAQTADALRNTPGTIFVKTLMDTMDGNAEAVAQAKKELVDLVEGNRSQGVILENVLQQNARFRDEPAFNAFDFITDLSDKAVDNMIERILNPTKFGLKGTNHREVFNQVLNRGSEVDLDLLMSARHAFGAGWDIADQVFKRVVGKNGESMFQVLLKPTNRNKELWRQMFDEAMPEGNQVLMPLTNQRAAVTVSLKAMNALKSFNELSQQLRIEANALRAARKQKDIPLKSFHLPPLDLSGKEQAFLIDKAGRMRTVVSADSTLELEKLVAKELALAGDTLGVVTRDTLERFYDARSQAFFEMTDYSRPSNQTGPATGKSFGNVIARGPKEFQKMLESVLRQYSDVGRETRMLIFEPEVQYLKLQKAASGVGKNKRTIHDELISRIAGVQNLDADSAVGRTLLWAETMYDRMLQLKFNTLGGLPQSGFNELRAKSRFAAMEERLAPKHRPFQTLTDYMERTETIEMPGSLRKHAAALNEITTALTIRMFDVGMGVINIISLGATLPAVIAMTGKRLDETVDTWKSRIGAYATVTEGGNAYFSPAKAVTSGVHFMFSQEGREVAKRAADLGFFDQFAAEQVEIFARTGEEFVQGLLRSFANKVSFITDRTERGARAMAFMTFYNMGRRGLDLDDRAAMAFAHKQANNTIADFRPSNRPAIFQGAAGMPLGLFTTYMWNYMQRFVNLAETLGTGSAKAAALQVGLQATLFGSESLPGWDIYTNMFMDNYDGSTNIVDRLNEAFGMEAADVFLNGTVANLPRLFGVADGISIGPRAGVGLPFQSGFGAQSIAGVRLITRAAQTFGKIVDSAIQDQGIDPTRVAEILAASNMNKGLSHAIELGITGRSQDHTGSVIEPNVSIGFNIQTGARLLGFKPLMADELRQENVRNRVTDRTRTELKARLADSLTSKIRGGRLDSNDIESAMESYVRAGGNSESFRRFFQSQVLRGTTSKIDLEKGKAIRKSADEGRLARLLYLSRD